MKFNFKILLSFGLVNFMGNQNRGFLNGYGYLIYLWIERSPVESAKLMIAK